MRVLNQEEVRAVAGGDCFPEGESWPIPFPSDPWPMPEPFPEPTPFPYFSMGYC